MSDFATLDYQGQIERLTQLGERALVHFGLAGAGLTLANYTNNAVYRVDAGAERFALRIHRPGLKKRSWIQSEREWLTALTRDTELHVPVPVDDIYTGTLEGADGEVYVVLFRWIEGHILRASEMTPEHAYAVGQFTARLHDASRKFLPSHGFERPRLDYEGLFGDDSPYNPGIRGEGLFSAEQRSIMAAASQHIQAVMHELDAVEGSFGLIHADLIWKNVLHHGDQVGAIDFDDCAYGYLLYDLAPMLLSFKDEQNGSALRQALWNGYTSTAHHAVGYQDLMETFVAARHIASIRWIAGNMSNPSVRDRAPEIITHRVQTLARFLDTGSL